jgi:hypothetical protein
MPVAHKVVDVEEVFTEVIVKRIGSLSDKMRDVCGLT